MAFWGIELKPDKHYTHSDMRGRRLHVSQATLGIGLSTEESIIVQCNVGDKDPIFLCHLLPKKLLTCPLNLEFEADDQVTFSVIGPCSVHLSGFFYGESMKTDIVMFPPSVVPSSGERIEEIVDEEKPDNENAVFKRSERKNEIHGSNDNNNSQQQIVVKSGRGIQVMESEDGFPMSSPAKGKNEKMKEKATDDPSTKSLKRKSSSLQDGNKARETDSSVPNTEVVLNDNLSPKQKKRKMAKGKEENAHEAGRDGKRYDIQLQEAIIEDMDQGLTVGKENDNKATSERETDSSVAKGKEEKAYESIRDDQEAIIKDMEQGLTVGKENDNKATSERETDSSVAKGKEEKAHEAEASRDGKRDDQEAIIKDMDQGLTIGKENDNKATSERETDSSVAKGKEEKVHDPMDQGLTVGKENDNKATSERNLDISVDLVADKNGSKGKEKQNNKKNKQERPGDANTKQSVTTDKEESAAVEKEDDKKGRANRLHVQDLLIGHERTEVAAQGSRVSIKYTGKLEDGKIFDSNDNKSPYHFFLDRNEVINGLDVGIKGMFVGGKRRLKIPPSMGYGKAGVPEAGIPPNAWLEFEVELVEVGRKR